MQGKGVEERCARRAIEQSAYSEPEACRALVRRKWRGTMAGQGKLTAYLTRRGFRRDDIQAALAAEEGEGGEEEEEE